MHNGESFLLLRFDLLKQCGLEHADQSRLVSYQEVRALEWIILVFVLVRCCFWLSFRETYGFDVGEVKLFKPGNNFEEEIIESDCTVVVSTNKVLIVNCGQDIDLRASIWRKDHFDKSLLVLLSDTLDDQGFVPN